MKKKEKQGLRLTKYRKLILEILKKHRHLDAYELFSLAKQEDSEISLSTVYRAINYFKEKGVILERKFGEDHSHYEMVDKGETGHIHLICEECGAVKEITDFDKRPLLKISEERGFKTKNIHIDVFGSCSKCSK